MKDNNKDIRILKYLRVSLDDEGDDESKLMPGEKLHTSSVVIMPYSDGVTNAHNAWRRLVKENFFLIGSDGRDTTGPFCAGIWGGMKTESVLKRIDTIKKNN